MNAALRQFIFRSIIDPLQRESARLLTKAALFLLAGFASLIGFIFLTAAFCIWIDQLAGALIAALSVAGVYITIALAAILVAVYGDHKKPTQSVKSDKREFTRESAQEQLGNEQRAEEITEAVQPLLELLRSLGLKREELAVLAGAQLAKNLPPLTLVGLAIVCGFLIGRMAKLPLDFAAKKTA